MTRAGVIGAAAIGAAALALLSGAMVPARAADAPPANAGMSAPDTWKPGTTADLILLDRLRGQPTTVTLTAGQETHFGSLSVRMTQCVFRPPDLPANAAAFLEITNGASPLFRGWILSNTPAVSQLEHPVYDVRLASCH